MNAPHKRLQSSLIQLLDFVRADADLAGEMEAARLEFFGADRPLYAHGPADLEAAAGRFAEWFMLDRRSPRTGATPAQTFYASPAMRSCSPADRDMLLRGVVGVFEVISAAGADVVVHDLLGRVERRARLPAGPAVDAGDSLIGRLFPAGDDLFLCSEAMAIHRGNSLATAFRRDAERNLTRGMSRRPDQQELEFIFWRSGAAAERTPIEHIEARLAKFLTEAGIADGTASDLSALIKVAPAPGTVLGPFLEEVAFETEADVEALRRILLDLWNAHHAEADAGGGTGSGATGTAGARAGRAAATDAAEHAGVSPDGPCHCGSARPYASCCLGADAAARIEEGLARGDDLEDLFAEVEAMVGAEGDPADPVEEAEEELAGAPLGDLDPFLAEYFWESAIDPETSAESRALLSLREELQGRTPPVDDVSGIDLAAVGSHVLSGFLTAPVGEGLSAAEARLCAVERFLTWVRENQSLDLLPRVDPLRAVLLPALRRADQAAAALETGAAPSEAPPRLVEVTSVTERTLSLKTRTGPGRRHEVALAPDVLALLQPGDLLLGSLSDAGVPAPNVRVVPGEGAPFLSGSSINADRPRGR